MSGYNHCAVCGLRIRRAEEADRPWLHDDPAYDPFKPPIHAPRPADAEGPASTERWLNIDGTYLQVYADGTGRTFKSGQGRHSEGHVSAENMALVHSHPEFWRRLS